MSRMTTVDRVEPPYEGDERMLLVAWLEFHRATLALKCEGLSPEQLRTHSVPPSTLSLLGLVRHMAEVENNWFRWWLAGDGPTARWEGDEDFAVDDADVEEAFTYWRDECNNARSVLSRFDSLDDVGAGQTTGAGISVRWTLIHMIEEYARHNGHADLLREAIDGTTGD
jgi:hypothetical protein